MNKRNPLIPEPWIMNVEKRRKRFDKIRSSLEQEEEEEGISMNSRWKKRKRWMEEKEGGAATTVDKTFTARQWRLRGALFVSSFQAGRNESDACHWVT